ncbi:hypothetical protein [Psychromonas sp.]
MFVPIEQLDKRNLRPLDIFCEIAQQGGNTDALQRLLTDHA